MDWARTRARRDEKHFSFGATYIRGLTVINTMVVDDLVMQTPQALAAVVPVLETNGRPVAPGVQKLGWTS